MPHIQKHAAPLPAGCTLRFAQHVTVQKWHALYFKHLGNATKRDRGRWQWPAEPVALNPPLRAKATPQQGVCLGTLTMVTCSIPLNPSPNTNTGPELLNKYLGETEKGVRTVFARAQASGAHLLARHPALHLPLCILSETSDTDRTHHLQS